MPVHCWEGLQASCIETGFQALEASDGHLARLEHLAATSEAPAEKGGTGAKPGCPPGNLAKDEIQEHSSTESTADKAKPAKPVDKSPHFADPVEQGKVPHRKLRKGREGIALTERTREKRRRRGHVTTVNRRNVRAQLRAEGLRERRGERREFCKAYTSSGD